MAFLLDYCSYCFIEAADWLYDRHHAVGPHAALDRLADLCWSVGMRFHNGADRLGYYDDYEVVEVSGE